jgi:type II secretory pathway component PulM
MKLSDLTARFAGMSPRERRGVSIAVAVVLGVVLFLGVIEPAFTGINRESKAIPQLAVQKNEVEQLAARVAAVSRPTTTQASRDALMQLAGGSGVKADITGDGPFRVAVKGVPFTGLMRFASQARQNHGVTVRDANLTRNGEGLVDGTLSLAK